MKHFTASKFVNAVLNECSLWAT